MTCHQIVLHALSPQYFCKHTFQYINCIIDREFGELGMELMRLKVDTDFKNAVIFSKYKGQAK